MYQGIGESRLLVTMRWENISNPYGTIAYYDEDQKVTKDYGSISDLLFQMDATCDEQGHPQRDTILCSFGGKHYCSKTLTMITLQLIQKKQAQVTIFHNSRLYEAAFFHAGIFSN